MPIRLKRVYEPKAEGDGFRILVDRLWPRGLGKDAAAVDLWLKDIAPSADLRRWFAHDPARWEEFQKRYRHELRQNAAAVAELREQMKAHKLVTLLYGARDTAHNDAVALKDFLESEFS